MLAKGSYARSQRLKRAAKITAQERQRVPHGFKNVSVIIAEWVRTKLRAKNKQKIRHRIHSCDSEFMNSDPNDDYLEDMVQACITYATRTAEGDVFGITSTLSCRNAEIVRPPHRASSGTSQNTAFGLVSHSPKHH